MMYVFTAVATIIFGVLGYLYKQAREKSNLLSELARLKNEREFKEWQDQIDRSLKNVSESEKDYNRTVDDYLTKHDPKSGKGG